MEREKRNGSKGRERRGREGKKRDNDNYYLLRMIINKRLYFCIQFFNFDIQYIDKYCIEIKCIPYIPEYGKVQTVSLDSVMGIWCVRAIKPVEAHTSPYGHGLHRSMV